MESSNSDDRMHGVHRRCHSAGREAVGRSGNLQRDVVAVHRHLVWLVAILRGHEPALERGELLRARAESMLGNQKAAIASWKAAASWKNGPGAPTDLERIAAFYLAQQAEKQPARTGK